MSAMPTGPLGEALPGDAPVVAALRAELAAAAAPEAVVARFWERHPGSPVLGALTEIAGARLREVTFLWREPAHSGTEAVLVHINSVTDRHREHVDPALMRRVDGTDVWFLSVLLPDDLLAAYRLVIADAATGPLPAGTGRARWIQVHRRGQPDPRAEHTLRHPLGAHSSVLTMPAAPTHPAWSTAPFQRGSRFTALRAAGRDLWIYSPLTEPAPECLLVLFDGEMWREMGIRDALDRWAGPGVAAVLVSAMGPERRGADLPHTDRWGNILADEVLPAVFAHLGRRFDPEHTIVSGQSYGGLAAAGIVVTRPDIATRGIAQSASFHFRAGAELVRNDERAGDLTARVARAGGRGRLILTVGTEEGTLVAQRDRFVAAAADSELEISTVTVRGGHDYAWWRHGLFAGLDALERER